MIKILLLFITLFFSFNLRVDAALCDKEHITKLKELAKQVEVSYEYLDYSEEILSGSDGSYSTNRYIVNIGLMTDELYVNYNDDKYVYDKSNGGSVTIGVNSGNVEFSINSSKCGEYKLRNVSLDLPRFNTYYYKKECRGLEEKVDVCDKWYQGTINDNLFYKRINEYLDIQKEDVTFRNKITLFLIDNYLFIIGGIVLIILVVVGIIFHRKRSVLE